MYYLVVCVKLIFLLSTSFASELSSLESEYKLIGNLTHLESLSNHETLENCTWTTFKAVYAKVQRRALLKVLRNCQNLKSISLLNIIWEWDSSSRTLAKKVHLPVLEVFEFESNGRQHWKSAKDLESIVFFYKNSITNNALTELQNVNFTITGNTTEGRLKLTNSEVEAIDIKDQDIWGFIFGLWSGLTKFRAFYCVLDVRYLKMDFMKEIILDNNKFSNGKFADILKTTKVATKISVSLLQDEAVDIALLPNRTLESFIGWRLSLRWNSHPNPIHFPKLRMLNMTYGDLDLKQFKMSEHFKILWMDHVYFWESSMADVSNLGNLSTLSVGCHSFAGICPTADIDVLPSSLQDLLLTNVEISFQKKRSFPIMGTLGFFYCKNFEAILSTDFARMFPNVRNVLITIDDIIRREVMKNALQAPLQVIIVGILGGARQHTRIQFQHQIQTYLNVSLPEEVYDGGRQILFQRTADGWTYKIFHVKHHQTTRIFKLIQALGITAEDVKLETLDVLYCSYTAFVYTFCAIGLVFNGLSILVFINRTQRSSTTYIMLGLITFDSLYLLTSLVTVEEFQDLFSFVFLRSDFNGYFAYPLNQTAYTGSVYMTILVTVERFIAICFPFRASTIFRIQNTKRYIMSVIIFAVTLNIPRWFEFIKWNYAAKSPIWSSNFPRQLHKFQIYEGVYQKGIWYFFVYAIPLVLIAILNLLIWIQARKAAEKRRLLGATPKADGEQSLTRILLSIVLIFFICNSLSASIMWVFISKNVEPEVAETIASLPIILNSATNFLLYYLMGTKFRTEFKNMLVSAWNFSCQKCTQWS